MGTFNNGELNGYINKLLESPSDVYSCTPNGMKYTKEFKGIIPKEVEKVFFQRKDWKRLMKNGENNLEIINKLLADL